MNMKNLKYIFLALCCSLLTTACMNDNFDEVYGNVRGNDQIKETNVVTIEQLKAKYAQVLGQQYGYAQITDNLQLKAYVTGNDREGNFYSQIALEDGTGAMVIAIGENGLFSYLPVGTEILVNLKDLYIGNYGYQTQIGTLYTSNKNELSVSRMSSARWEQHFTYTGKNFKVSPMVFDQSKVKDSQYLAANAGRLMTLKGVTFTDGGKKVYANKADIVNNNSVERELKELNKSNIVVRSSTYADFAAMTLPTGKVDITGIFTRYNNKWQVYIREISDVQPAK